MFIFFPEKRLLSSLSNFPSLRSLSNRIYCLRRFHGDEAWRQTSGSYRWVRKKWLQCSAEDQVARYVLQGRHKASLSLSLCISLCYIRLDHRCLRPLFKMGGGGSSSGSASDYGLRGPRFESRCRWELGFFLFSSLSYLSISGAS